MIARIACATATGVTVTLLLLFLMQLLIRFDTPLPGAAREPLFRLASVRIKVDPPVKEETNHYEQLKHPVKPTPARPGLPVFVPLVPGLPSGVPARPPVIETALPAVHYDAPLVTVMAVEPDYPMRASEEGLEGFVTVRFDVQANGEATNFRIVAASHPLFERSAVKAMSRFRFRARVVDGVPQPSYGLERRFVYRMERG
jgi:periplasmic protein TonB